MVPRQTSPPPPPPQINPEPEPRIDPEPLAKTGKGEKGSTRVAARDYAEVVTSSDTSKTAASTGPSTSTNTPLTRSRTPSPTPLSPPREKATSTTTPPTPKGSGTGAEAGGGGNVGGGGNLDEFGLPRIAPPTGYFDGDNEMVQGVLASGEAETAGVVAEEDHS